MIDDIIEAVAEGASEVASKCKYPILALVAIIVIITLIVILFL